MSERDGQDTQGAATTSIGRGTTSDATRLALHTALYGGPGAVVAYERAEKCWALAVRAGIIRAAGDERTAGDAPGARSAP